MPPEGLRVWSVLVTIFGDLAGAENARLGSPVLAALTQPLEIRPEALRVAIHRLRKDDWLVAERQGRSSRYGLSARGLAETRAAGRRIYGPDRETPDDWCLTVLPPQIAEGDPTNWIEVLPGVGLGPAREFPPQALVLQGQITQLPDWVQNQVGPPELGRAFSRLDGQVAALMRTLPGRRLGPVDTAILRVLIVHEWRRLVLRAPDVPPSLLPKDWPGIGCRHRVQEALAHLPRPDLDVLHRAID